jgi:hypothetical protein
VVSGSRRVQDGIEREPCAVAAGARNELGRHVPAPDARRNLDDADDERRRRRKRARAARSARKRAYCEAGPPLLLNVDDSAHLAPHEDALLGVARTLRGALGAHVRAEMNATAAEDSGYLCVGT